MNVRLFLVRALNYVTNHVISHVPSFAVRHAWYRRLGLELGPGSDVYLNCRIWFYGPGAVARSGARIGKNTKIFRGCLLDVRGPLTIGDNVSVSPGY